MSEIMLPLLAGLICSGIALLGLVGLIALLYINHKRSREKVPVLPNWPTVPGRVTIARVEETARTRVDDDTFYYPSIEFEYTVENQLYTGRQTVGKAFNLESMAKRVVANYPPGTEVVVSYNPGKPGEARLLIK
jgi:hypothetical protein